MTAIVLLNGYEEVGAIAFNPRSFFTHLGESTG